MPYAARFRETDRSIGKKPDNLDVEDLMRILLITVICLPVLAGCAAALVPSTEDPAKKLAWAKELIDHRDRPLPAERLINEALGTYQESGDELGLAEAYRVYGLFFKSGAVQRWEGHYRTHGFLDKTATYDTRMEKAEESLVKSRDLLVKNGDLDSLPNVYLLLGWTYKDSAQTALACAAFDKSLETYQIRKMKNPRAQTSLPKEYSSFEQGIADFKKQTGCDG